MKKFLLIIYTLLLFSCLISCSNKNAYNDGIYLGEGNNYSEGSDDVTINIESGEIVDLVIRHLDTNGKEIHYPEWDGKFKPNIQQYRTDIMREVLKNQNGDITLINEIYDISSSWKLAINNALEKAKK